MIALAAVLTASQAIAGSVSYTYDALGRVVSAQYSTGAQIAYRYDVNGNRTQSSASGVAPIAGPVSFSIAENASATSVPLNISGGAATGVAITAGASNGQAVLSGAAAMTYQPNPNFTGADSFQYTVTNTVGTSAPGTVTVAVYGPPVAASSSATVAENSGAASIGLNLTGGPATAVSITSGPTHGTTSTSGASISYAPFAGYAGADSFQYTASNAAGVSAPATVTITVSLAPPIANPVSASVNENSGADPITLNITGGAATGVAIASGPGHGAATASGTSISYTPNTGFAGTDSFQYTATNGAGTSAPATVTVAVNPLAPVANPVSTTVTENTSNDPIALNVTGGAATSVSISTQAAHGVATASGTSITYTPTTGYVGSDSFQYTATNLAGTSTPATASVVVQVPNGTILYSINRVGSWQYTIPAGVPFVDIEAWGAGGATTNGGYGGGGGGYAKVHVAVNQGDSFNGNVGDGKKSASKQSTAVGSPLSSTLFAQGGTSGTATAGGAGGGAVGGDTNIAGASGTSTYGGGAGNGGGNASANTNGTEPGGGAGPDTSIFGGNNHRGGDGQVTITARTN